MALRRCHGERVDEANLGLRLGLRIARLAAEAPEGSRLSIEMCAPDGQVRITGRVMVPAYRAPSRSGLLTAEAAVDQLASEFAGLFDQTASTAIPVPFDADSEYYDRPALQILPRGRSQGLRSVGYLGEGLEPRDDWAVPRVSDGDELARLLLKHPHVSLVQVVEPITDDDVDAQRRRCMADLPAGSVTERAEAVGTPVRVGAALVATAVPWTLPLRVREHLRGWFTVLDLEEGVVSGLPALVVMPELIAAGLLRFPVTTDNSFPGLAVEPVTVPLKPAGLPADGVRIGVAKDLADSPFDVYLDDQMMSRHVHVIGETGSGKSTLLAAMAVETAANGGGLLMLDPHGTTVDRVIRELPVEARDRVVLIRCGDVANPVRLNPMAVSDPDLQDMVISDLLDAFQVLYDPRHEGIVGPRFQHIMRHTLSTLATIRGPRASLLDVPRLLYDRELLKASMPLITDPEVRAFWVNDVVGNRSSDANEVIAWVSSKFTAFASNRVIRAVLATGEDALDPTDAIKNNRIVLVDLDKGSSGVMGSRIIGMMFLLRFWMAALGDEQPDPFTVLVDEAASFSAIALPSILSEGRKFGLRAVVAHQYMDQLDPVIADAIEGSVASRIVFRVGREDAVRLSVSTGPEFGPLDLTALPQLHAAARIADAGVPIRPFTLQIDHNERAVIMPDADDAIARIRARTIEELVDPFRAAQRMSLGDLASGEKIGQARGEELGRSKLPPWMGG